MRWLVRSWRCRGDTLRRSACSRTVMSCLDCVCIGLYPCAKCPKLTFMSDFKLSELAVWLHRGEKTIRRWCISGRIKGAFQTKGGHWRVRAENHAALAASKIMRVLDNAPSVGAKRKFQPRSRKETAKTLNASTREFNRFLSRGRGKFLMHAVNAIIADVDLLEISKDQRTHLLEKLKTLVEGEVSQNLWLEIQRAAAGIWLWKAENQKRRGISGAAAAAGLPRSTFRNYFASCLPSRSDAVDPPNEHDEIDFDSMDARLGWSEPAD